ncbi:uncharacterized protein N7487_003152 [Penicillium crustosum]|uniref:uncharacterized protein n=1 Tax=Penicillium crustosum TaxID=36656 RepID=UPI0023A71966|nr:uncharacterized protein N7487_003152 [Penicillium crustosum]KAJ5419602.1 hypothetical protein N7487_003152 [Penicillium crustosum]
MADEKPAELFKRGLNEVDDSSSSRSPTRRRLASKSAEPAESLVPYPIPDDNSISSDGQLPPLPPGDASDDNSPPVSDEQVAEYYRKGAAYEAWIADPTRDECPCELSEHTLFGLLNHSDKKKRFHCSENQFDDPPLPIQEDLEKLGFRAKGKRCRFARLTLSGYDKDGYKKETEYQHSFAEGLIIGECIYRYAGPNWSHIALAQYKFDYPIDTLKYLYFTNVQNEETLPYVQEILYPRHGIDWPRVDRIQSQVWEHGTEGYREILGTKLGNAAACLVVGAWERGTHRIARVHTLGRLYHIHLRFDIEPVPAPGTA